jgi:formylglycine-generating enzyme required for sulfatase activity
MQTTLRLAVSLTWCTLVACAHAGPAGARARADLAAGAMVQVPGGRFQLEHGSGPTGEIPTYVAVSPFLLDATEVTVAAYAECAREGRCEAAAEKVAGGSLIQLDRARWSRACNQDRADRADHPVNCVDWSQAAAYCAWLGKRLPTEEEWEWAARNGGEGTPYPWGDAPPAGQPCWNGEGNDAGRGKRAGTCAAGSHPGDATAAGVKDLAGGVAEWTASETVVGAESSGRGGTPVKVFRGGAWADEDPRQLAGFARSTDLPGRRDSRVGFRCASNP